MINIVVLQEDLEKAVSTVYRFISSHPQLPILSNVLLFIDKGRIKLCATNLEAGINYWLGAKVTEEGKTTLPAKILLDVISNLPQGKIDLKEEGGIINLSSGGTNVNIPTTPANEFPNVEYKASLKGPTFTPELFTTITKQVGFCVGSDSEVKPEYTGILLLPQGKGFLAVATDGVRLSQKKFTSPLPFPEKILLPAKIVTEVPRTFVNQNVWVSTQENQVLFATGDIILASRTLDAEKFPDFAKIIPKEKGLQVNMDREELEKAIHLSSIFARDYAVKFVFDSAGCTVSSENAQSGGQKTTIAAKINPSIGSGQEEMAVSFNWRFINEFLGSVTGDEVEISLASPTSPGVFSDPKDPDYMHLIMPIRNVTPETEE